MLNSNGIDLRDEQGIFPLIVFETNTKIFRCLGSTFFINGLGVFVTAKHVFNDEMDGNKLFFVVQNLSDHQTVNREIISVCLHPTADIAVGLVGKGRDPMTAKEVEFEIAPNCRLSFKKMEIGSKLLGFGYPRTEKIVNANLTTFNFKGTWSEGIIQDFHPEGFSKLRNQCYQTNMVIESGCSGGPVFKDGHVVGVNSSSFDLLLQENPISFITPVSYLLDLRLSIENQSMSLKEIIERGVVIAEY